MKKLKTHRYLLVTVMGFSLLVHLIPQRMSGLIRVLIQILTLNRSPERLPLFSRSIKVKM